MFSPKDLQTFQQLESKPTDWSLTPVKWVKEKREMLVKVDCEVCYGNGRTNVNKITGKPARNRPEGYKIIEQKAWKEENPYVECPVCPPSRGRKAGFASTGKIKKMKEVEVMVGYPQWVQGTIFGTTRFAHCDCQLCGKKIKYTNLVPVQGKDAQGHRYGMWVGLDCAKKFPFDKETLDKLKGVGTKKIFDKEMCET